SFPIAAGPLIDESGTGWPATRVVYIILTFPRHRHPFVAVEFTTKRQKAASPTPERGKSRLQPGFSQELGETNLSGGLLGDYFGSLRIPVAARTSDLQFEIVAGQRATEFRGHLIAAAT